jgi:hypothetical protein
MATCLSHRVYKCVKDSRSIYAWIFYVGKLNLSLINTPLCEVNLNLTLYFVVSQEPDLRGGHECGKIQIFYQMYFFV